MPLFVNLAAKRVVIFGGGTVAERKAVFFAREADVRIVSRSFSKKIMNLPVQRMVLDIRECSDTDLENIISDAFIVVAALTDRTQNNRIGKICRQKGLLFNNAAGDQGDVIIPSRIEGKRYTIAVTTHGRGPALSRFLREHLDRHFAALDPMIALQEKVRNKLKTTEPSQKKRSAILRKIIRDPEVWEALERSPYRGEQVALRKHIHG